MSDELDQKSVEELIAIINEQASVIASLDAKGKSVSDELKAVTRKMDTQQQECTNQIRAISHTFETEIDRLKMEHLKKEEQDSVEKSAYRWVIQQMIQSR